MSTRVDFYRQWRDLMRSWGFVVHEAADWETRDAEPHTAYDPTQLYVEHHDASTSLSGNWGALAYILQNKLANIVTARNGEIMLCAAGVEWHAGVGAWSGIPTNGANPKSMGNEVCNSGAESYSPDCTRAIVAGEKAWTIVAKRGADRIVGHKEWAKPVGRKNDPRVDMNERRAVVAAYTSTTAKNEENDMYEVIDRQVADARHTQLANELTAQRGIQLSIDGKLNVVLADLATDEDLSAEEIRQAAHEGTQAAIAAAGDIVGTAVSEALTGYDQKIVDGVTATIVGRLTGKTA